MSMYAREILSWSEEPEKTPVPPEDSILWKIMHNWQEFNSTVSTQAEFIHALNQAPTSWKISSLGWSHAMTLKSRNTKTTIETIQILIDTKNLGREGGFLKIKLRLLWSKHRNRKEFYTRHAQFERLEN